MEIRFKKLVPEAKTPYKKIDVDAGFDLFATDVEINENYVQYKTGIAVEIPEGYVGLVFPRSSVSNYDLMLKNGVGVIDASYRGEIMCRFNKEPYIYNKLENINSGKSLTIGKIYEVGERVAQIVFIAIPQITLIESEELSDSVRGEGSFGSSGR